MTSDQRNSVWLAALTAFALFANGCHGWMPAMLQGLTLLLLGAALLAVAGPSRFGAAWGWLRYVPLGAAVWGRQMLDVDLIATLGMMAGLSSVGGDPARRATRGLFAVALVQIALTTTIGFHAEESLAHVLSAVASSLAGRDIALGPVYGGARSLLIGGALWLAVVQIHRRREVWRLGVLVVLALLATAVVGVVAENLPQFGSLAPKPITSIVAAQLPWIPFVVVAIALPMLVAGMPPPERGAVRDPLLTALALAASVAVIASLAPGPLRPAHHIVFYRPGFSNWEVADATLSNAGPYSTGMLGTLPQFARAMGLRAELVDSIDAATLGDCDILVLINQHAPLTSGAPAAIAAWVREGGHLVVVGDHTFLKADGAGFTNFLDEPLAGTAIRFPNNSSDHLTRGCLDATVTFGLGRRLDCLAHNPYMPIIGAGLEVHWPARPIVITEHAYEDLGRVPKVAETESIGDLMWNPGERLGGVVQMAEQQIGRGRVTCVADTTGVHNIARSWAWRSIGNLLLGRERDARWEHWAMLAALLGIAGAALARRQLAAMPLVATAVLAAIAGAGNLPNTPMPLVNPDEPLLILDTAVRPEGRLGEWTPDGHLSQLSTSLRVGYLPLFTSTEEHGIPVGCRVILVSRPQVDPGSAWRQRLVDWVRGGGHLVFAGSYSAQLVLGELLAEFGCRIDPFVIGPQSVSVGDSTDPQAIRLQESWNLRLLTGEWSRIVYGPETTSLATRAFGAGRFTVVTDESFLQNRNLESKDFINPGNLRFMMAVLGKKGARW